MLPFFDIHTVGNGIYDVFAEALGDLQADFVIGEGFRLALDGLRLDAGEVDGREQARADNVGFLDACGDGKDDVAEQRVVFEPLMV